MIRNLLEISQFVSLKKNPLIKDKDIGVHFAKEFKIDKIAKSAISRILPYWLL